MTVQNPHIEGLALGSQRGLESLISKAFHTAPIAILLLDGNREATWVNQCFLDMWAIDRETVMSLDEVQMANVILGRLMDDSRSKDILRALKERPTLSLNDDLLLEDGRRIEAQTFPLLEDKGPIGRAWFFIDHTERQSAQEEHSLTSDVMEQTAARMTELAERYYLAKTESDAARAKLEQQQVELERLANTDGLTGILNRRRVLFEAAAALDSGARRGEPVSVILFDVDHFKSVNDAHGHAVGDSALIAVCEATRSAIGNRDQFGRFGGEEFVVILPGQDITQAARTADDIRRAIATTPVETSDGALFLTASFGVARVASDDLTIDDALRAADEALYRAKNAGRNRVETA